MQHPDEGTIHAWIDGELSPDEAASLEAHLEECPECSALAAEARGLAAASSRIVSALDTVPGDVIPKMAPRHRPWYASTQLRAAAAVVVVAGASLLVMRNGGEMKMKRALETSAAAPATSDAAQSTVAAAPSLDSATMERMPASVAVAESPKASPKRALEGRVSGAAGSDLRKETANEAARDAVKIAAAPEVFQAPPVGAARAAADEMSAMKSEIRRDSAAARRLPSGPQLDNVVITRAAVATAPPQLKKLRGDSAGNQTVYEISPGVEVTLIDTGRPQPAMLRVSAQLKEKQAATSAPAAPPPAAEAETKVINSITWTNKNGHVMVLSGALSKLELETVRQRLPADKR